MYASWLKINLIVGASILVWTLILIALVKCILEQKSDIGWTFFVVSILISSMVYFTVIGWLLGFDEGIAALEKRLIDDYKRI